METDSHPSTLPEPTSFAGDKEEEEQSHWPGDEAQSSTGPSSLVIDHAGASGGSIMPAVDGEATASASGSSNAANFVSSMQTPFSRHLGRNRACQSCRERKLKCDGVRPICGKCGRAWALRRKALKEKGYIDADLTDMEKPCVYIDKAEQRRPSGGRNSSSAKSLAGMRGKASRGDVSGAGEDTTMDSVGDKTEGEGESKRMTRDEAQEECVRLRRVVKRLEEEYDLDPALITSIANAEPEEKLQWPKRDGENDGPNQDEMSIAEVLANTMREGAAAGPIDPQLLDSVE